MWAVPGTSEMGRQWGHTVAVIGCDRVNNEGDTSTHTQTLGALPVTDWRSCHLLQLDPAVWTRHQPTVSSGRCWEMQSNWASSVLCIHSDWSEHQGKWLVSYLHFVLLLLRGYVSAWFPYLDAGCSVISVCTHSSKALKFTRTIISVRDNSNISATGNFLYHQFTTPMCTCVYVPVLPPSSFT